MLLKNLIDTDARLTADLRLSPGANPWWRVVVLLAHSGDSWFWCIGLLIIWLLDRGEWHVRSALLAGGVVGLAIVVIAIKFTIRRSRPAGEWGAIYRNTDPHSFPSGHAARAFMLMVAAWGLGPLWFGILLTIWAPLVSLARVVTGLHYFSDILAGAVLGTAAGFALIAAQPLFLTWFPFLF